MIRFGEQGPAPRTMSVGLCVTPMPPVEMDRLLVYVARLGGVGSVWTVDHWQGLFPREFAERELPWATALTGGPHAFFDYQVLLGYLAKSAGSLRLGVGVTDAIRRHPVLIAQAMLTLAHLTRRAPILGIGAGERENVAPYGLDFSHPVGLLEEAVQILRMCFDHNGPLDYRGRFFQLDHAIMDLRAPQGRAPEIWIGGQGPRMLRLTGRHGDGWFPTTVATPEDYAAKLEVIRSAAREAGRDPYAITPALIEFIVPASSEKEARRILDSRFGRLLALQIPADQWRAHGSRHPFGDEFRGYVDWMPETYDHRTLEDAMSAVPAGLLGHGVLSGTPDAIAARLIAFRSAGMREVSLLPVSMVLSRRSAIYALWAVRRIAQLVARQGFRN